MAHMIDTTTGRAAIAYTGQTPWHGLGQALTPGADVDTWTREAGLAYDVLESPVQYSTPASTGPQTWPARKVLHRSDTGAPLAVVSDSYHVVQPSEVMDFFRKLVDLGGFQLETAGALSDGRRVWALASVGDAAPVVDRDLVRPYLLLGTSYDGTMATVAKFTAIRVVCNNTITAAVGGYSNGRVIKGESETATGYLRSAVRVLHSERFQDKAPNEVFAALLDEGTYLCSVRTMYRLLEQAGEVRERRDQLRHPHYQKPQLLATGPNQVWSWDITTLLGPVKWTYFYLYVILDIFSRYVVGWMVAERESAGLAKRLIGETCRKQNIAPDRLTIHADRGTSMTSKPVALLLADLGVTKTHSRPHVSDDNPFSESQFKTLKYRPEFPERFGSIQDARAFCHTFFPWYNTEHHHSGIGLLTPDVLHYGRADEVIAHRQVVLSQAFQRNPERFVRAHPRPPARPTAVWINPPPARAASEQEQH